MDPFSIVVSVANLVALVDNLYRGAKYLRRAFEDPKTDALYVRLITEKARYAEWKRRMGMESNVDPQALLQRLPDDAREALMIILGPFEKYVKKSEGLAKKYSISKPANVEGGNRTKETLKRLDFRFHGIDELSDMLDTLKACNDGLLTVAPPAPEYYSSLQSQDPVLDTGGLSEPVDSLRRPSEFLRRPSSNQRRNLERREEDVTGQPSIQTPRLSRPIIDMLHSTCMNAIRHLITHYPNQREYLEVVGDRLSIWGSGLFRHCISIDQALNSQNMSIRMLRGNVCGVLAAIAVTLGEWFS